MLSEKKVAANRRNARKSTGPRSATGKAKARLNAIKHGLTALRPIFLDGESEDEFEAMRTGFHQALSPIGEVEYFLVERMVQRGWQMGRAERVEIELFSRQILADEAVRLETALTPRFKTPAGIASEFLSGLEPTDEADSEKQLKEKRLGMARLRLGTSFVGLSSGEDILGKLERYETAAERSFFRAAHELERLQRRRMGEDVEAPRVADLNVSFHPTGVEGTDQAPAASPSSAGTSSVAGTRSEAEDSPKAADARDTSKAQASSGSLGCETPAPSDYGTNPESDARHGNSPPEQAPRAPDRRGPKRDTADTPRDAASGQT